MSQKPPSPFLGQQRPRSNSVIRLKSSQNSPVQSPTQQQLQQQQKQNFKRSMSVSEGLHVKLPVLHHSESAEAFPYSPISQTTTSNICPSESNWANKYDDFDIGKPIGYGSSAVVYEAVYKPLKKRVAIKMIDLDMFERNQIDELRRETALMALSKHPNVLRVYGSFVNGSKLYIVTPYLAAGSCLDIMKTAFPEGLDEISIATILRQALEGLIYLHKNGHIHRDVKAGNLLMDQQGTVLLADFGVSSSLTENGDVRKTFVGTPCWMAPEVMEQAGYDYKADIWSFGITSLELATGHAPFAKFPPMKVLMMTLSNAPPTLDREGGKHKYSKAFKDMIDSCLQKDPSKRPSAEKLLTFPFFKQAKKRDYLIKTILSNTVPLDQRPHKKVPQKHISFESTEQWDFDTLSDEEADSHPKKPETPSIISPTTTPLERSRSMVQFEDCPKPVHIDRTKSTNVSPITSDVEPIPVKKHISFGEAVIRDPPLGRTVMSPLVESPPPVTTTNTTTTTTTTTTAAAAAAAAAVAAHEPILTSTPIAQTPGSSVSFAATPPAYAPPVLHSAPLSKKSRFVIEDATPTTQQLLSAESPSSDSPISNASPAIDIESVGLGILTTPSIQNSNTIPGATTTASAGAPTVATVAANAAAVAANISNNSNTLQEGEFKKGRFSVNQTPNRATTPAVEEASYINSPYGNEKPTQLEYKPTPMSRAASQDSFQERKSRFEVKHSNTSGTNMQTPISVTSTPIEPNTPMQSLPLTRENSNTSALSRDSSMNNSKVSRFSIEKPEAAVVGPCCELPAALVSTMSPECRKKGRFELTGGSNTPSESGGSNRQDTSHMDSPQSTVAPSPAISPCSSLSRGQAHRILDSSMSHMVYSHMESLIKQTEIQKNMLHDLLVTMPLIYGTNSNNSPQSILTRSRTISDSKKPAFTHNEEVYQKAPTSNPSTSTNVSSSLTNEINVTIEHLQQLLLSSSKEKERLAKENEELRKEVDRLKKSQQQQQQGSLLKKPSIEPSQYDQQSEKTSSIAPEATSTTANTHQQDKAL